MRTRLAPLIVVKQEPKDELAVLDALNDDNNNNNSDSFLLSSVHHHGGEVGGEGATSPALSLPTPPCAVPAAMTQQEAVAVECPAPTGSAHFGGYGHSPSDSNNNKSCEVNKNLFVVARNGGQAAAAAGFADPPPTTGNELFLRSVVEGIKVEKCFYGHDRNNNNCDWYGPSETGLGHSVKAEPATGARHHQHPSEAVQAAVSVGQNSCAAAAAAAEEERKSM